MEACLNSRPLIPLKVDPSDNKFLTPASLLSQSNNNVLPENIYLDLSDRYKLIQQKLQDWWWSWSTECLQTLQERHKWHLEKKNLEINDVVLISDETMPPSYWPLAKVIGVSKGTDGLVRVVTFKTGSTTLKRPIHKLILLDVLDEEKQWNFLNLKKKNCVCKYHYLIYIIVL